MKNIYLATSLRIDGYPIAIIEKGNESFLVYSGEGDVTEYDFRGNFLKNNILSSLGFSDAFEFKDFVVMTNLSGDVLLAESSYEVKKLGRKITSPIFANGNLYFIQNHLLHSCKNGKEATINKIEKLSQVEQIFPCGDMVLVICDLGWFLVKENLPTKFLGQFFLTLTSGAFMSKNSTFHFTLIRGEMGLIQLKMDSSEVSDPLVTEVAGPIIKMLGPCGSDKIAISYYNQQILLVSNSENYEECIHVIISTLKHIPKKVLNHNMEPYFLVQESDRTVSMWTTLSPDMVWKEEFAFDICYMKFSDKHFYVGLGNGDVQVFNFG